MTTIARARAGRTGPAVRAVTRDGRSPGLTIAAPSTIAPPPIPQGGPGPSASAWCGGTPRRERWTGLDTPDFVLGKPPEMRPDWSRHPTGMDALGGDAPFIMEADGRCLLFVPSGLKDGPLPTHYEPVESPVANPLYPQQINPAAKLWTRPGNELHAPEDPRYPYIFTTYRLTELHCGGIATRVMPHTAELQPEAFVEISPELAAETGIANLDWAVLSTARGEIEAKALVTERHAAVHRGWPAGPPGRHALGVRLGRLRAR